MSQENLNKVFSQLGVLETISAAKTLDVYDTGKIFSITQSGDAFAFTLPTATTAQEASDLVGWNATFILTTASTANVTIVRGDTSNDALEGSVATNGQDALTGVTLATNVITFSNDAVVGDRCHIVCVAATATATTFVATCHSNT